MSFAAWKGVFSTAHATAVQKSSGVSTIFLPMAYQSGRAEPTPEPTSPVGSGRVIYVPGDAASIEEGLGIAKLGDTVLVDPGKYSVKSLKVPAGVTLSGAGRGVTTVSVTEPAASAISLAADAVVRDLSLGPASGAAIAVGLRMEGARTVIDSVEVRGFGTAVEVPEGSSGALATVNRSVLHHSGQVGLALARGRRLVANHNTLVDNPRGMELKAGAQNVVLADNLVVGGSTCLAAAFGVRVDLRRNVLWDCAARYEGLSAGAADAFLNPLFNDRTAGDYTPSAGSPLALGANRGAGAIPAAEGDGPSPEPLAAQSAVGGDGKQTWRLGWRDDGHPTYWLYLGHAPGQYDQRIEVSGITTSLPPMGLDETLYAAVSNTDALTPADPPTDPAKAGLTRRESRLSEEVRLGPGLPSGPGAHLIRVPAEVATISEALAAAESGDTIWVGPGTYSQDAVLELKSGVRLVGAGWAQTTIRGSGNGSVVKAVDFSTIEGFTIRGGGQADPFDSGIWIANGPATITRNRLTGNHHGLYAYCLPELTPGGCNLKATISWNIIDHNTGSGVDGTVASELDIRHNTIDQNGIKVDWDARGIALASKLSTAIDNVVARSYTDGLHNPQGANTGHNLLWHNGLDYSIRTTPDTTTVYEDPKLRDAASGDYRIGALSAAIGRAENGGDIGAMAFMPGLRIPTNLTVKEVQAKDADKWHVSWSPVDGASGYRLFLALEGDVFNAPNKVGPSTEVDLVNLPGDVTYGVVVSAYNDAGEESLVTRPVTFTVPPTPDFSTGDNGDPVQLVGDWKKVDDPKAMDGSYLVSDKAGDRLRFTFAGDRLVLYRRISTDGGQASIKIDGASYGNLSFNFIETRNQVPSVFENLGAGTHRITVEVGAAVGNGGKRVAIDDLTVPGKFSPSAGQQTALDRANMYRRIMSLPPFRLDTALNLAAQAHAEYATTNPGEAHGETPGRKGFIGSDLGRFGYFGYTQGGSFEVMHFTGNPIAAVDGWMSTVYHRLPFAEWTIQDAGYGISLDSKGGVDVMDFGTRPNHARRPETRHIATYPADGEGDVPPSWGGGESPDPLPGKAKPVGYPISLHITRPARKGVQALGGPRQGPPGVNVRGQNETSLGEVWLGNLGAAPRSWLPGLGWGRPLSTTAPQGKLTSAELFDSRGSKVQAYVLDKTTDAAKFLGDDDIFIIAKSPMAAGASYTAHFVGTDSGDEAYDVTWRFTTR